jgi:transposase-like protein
MLPEDLPADLPSSVARFGSDEQCHDYLVRQRWPEGFACRACGQRRAWRLKRRHLYECAACGQQHSLLKGTIFEQTRTGLAKWFLAIYLVSSSKGGISALELQRQIGFASYQTAWTWLHKLRRAMVRPGREPLSAQIEADETYVGGTEPGKRGRGAGGKTVVAGAVESGCGERRGRRLGRLRLAALADASRASLEGFLAAHLARPAAVTTDGWSGYGGLASQGWHHEAINLSATWGDAALRLPAIHLVPRVEPRAWLSLARRWLLGTHQGAVRPKHLPAYLDEFVFRFNRRFARLVEHAVQTPPTTYRGLVATPA